MTELRTEEEQIEAIKNWWKENGRSTVLGVLVAVALVLGWRGWQQNEQTKAENASALYQNMIGAVTVQPGQGLTEKNRKTAEYLAAQLKDEFSDQSYAQYAALWLAKSAVDQGDLAAAASELSWVLQQEPKDSLNVVAELRLARIYLAQDKTADALQLLQGTPVQGFEASFYEVKGDVLMAAGNESAARDAYVKAKASPKGDQRPLLTIKLDDLAVVEGN